MEWSERSVPIAWSAMSEVFEVQSVVEKEMGQSTTRRSRGSSSLDLRPMIVASRDGSCSNRTVAVSWCVPKVCGLKRNRAIAEHHFHLNSSDVAHSFDVERKSTRSNRSDRFELTILEHLRWTNSPGSSLRTKEMTMVTTSVKCWKMLNCLSRDDENWRVASRRASSVGFSRSEESRMKEFRSFLTSECSTKRYARLTRRPTFHRKIYLFLFFCSSFSPRHWRFLNVDLFEWRRKSIKNHQFVLILIGRVFHLW